MSKLVLPTERTHTTGATRISNYYIGAHSNNTKLLYTTNQDAIQLNGADSTLMSNSTDCF